MKLKAFVQKELEKSAKRLKLGSVREIRDHLYSNGLTTTEQTVRNWLDGVHTPSVDNLIGLAKIFEWDLHHVAHLVAGLPYPIDESAPVPEPSRALTPFEEECLELCHGLDDPAKEYIMWNLRRLTNPDSVEDDCIT